ncbi:hypothetical protein J2848_001976 [Azospirillum lipoferum]|uniref:STAS domain-containing protein n=1 Tax=Azospirillum lipoferum TaxID=193 RepID=A0A5A9GSZ8_AZOLI|nr:MULTISPECIES: hypothetical protein [Azospirillum]KAA0597568.1 hypothetical protein FZ942_00230 [Azospirillum lipoferum]MCP1610317.1 hypothetical protein [Azospirillum lipoferum]MDW5534190.1 hypothetical protein [Azospirillum sp. NL1]
MTASYLVELKDWGLHVRLQGTLSLSQRDAIARQVEVLCATLGARGTPWCSLVEFDHFEADGLRPDILVALMTLARRCGHQRSAVVMTDWHWASVMADAMIAAGIDDQARIFVLAEGLQAGSGLDAEIEGRPAGDLAGMDSAMAWVLNGGAVPMVSKAA